MPRQDEEHILLVSHSARLSRVVLRCAGRDGLVPGLLDEAGLLGRPGAEEEAVVDGARERRETTRQLADLRTRAV